MKKILTWLLVGALSGPMSLGAEECPCGEKMLQKHQAEEVLGKSADELTDILKQSSECDDSVYVSKNTLYCFHKGSCKKMGDFDDVVYPRKGSSFHYTPCVVFNSEETHHYSLEEISSISNTDCKMQVAFTSGKSIEYALEDQYQALGAVKAMQQVKTDYQRLKPLLSVTGGK